MKKFNWNILTTAVALTCVLSFLAAVIPFFQVVSSNSLFIGIPFSFFRVHVGGSGHFSTHFGIAGFLADVTVMYVICYLFKKHARRGR